MAAKSDEGELPQSEAAFKSEGSPWETDLEACGWPPEAQHPWQDGNGGKFSPETWLLMPGAGGSRGYSRLTASRIRWNSGKYSWQCWDKKRTTRPLSSNERRYPRAMVKAITCSV